MDYTNDPREAEFKETIKAIERQRFWFPVVLLGFLIAYIWLSGGDVFERPTTQTAYPIVILLALFFVGFEVLSIKILLIKAEYRDWLRDFKKAKWEDLNRNN